MHVRTASLSLIASPLHRTCLTWLLLALCGATLWLPAGAQNLPKATVSKSATQLPGARYAWVAMPARLAAESDARVQDAKFRQQLQAALDKALQAKGYRLVPASQADILVAYRVGIRDLEQALVKEQPASATPQAAMSCTAEGCSQLVIRSEAGTPVLSPRVKHETEGGLQVEVLEPREIRVVWRATQRGAVKRGEVTQARLDALARNVLAELPAVK
jgi:hypothetical protein